MELRRCYVVCSLLWLFGGFTAIPTLLLAVWWLSPEAQYLPDPKASSRHDQHPQGENVKSGVIKAGWITVRRTFEPLSESYAGFIASGYKSWMSKDPRRNRPKDQFFAMLKQTSSSVVLYLYDSDPAVLANNLHPDVWAAIDVSLFKPALYPADKDTPDAELFMKKTAVVLWPRASQRDNQPGEKETQIETQPAPAQGLTDSMEASRPLPWFLFPKTNFDKEDWYHTLLDVSRIGTSDATSSSSAACGLEAGLYHPDHMARLMASIDQKPEDLPIRGLNAMLGRLFLGVYQTQAVEDYIVGRIMRKLSKVQRPSFLSEIKVAQVNVGDSCPLFSAPLLKDLSPDGTASMTVGMRYKGECSVTVATVARITLQRIKTVDVALVLKVTLRRLEGQLMFMVKPPPSNRMWMGSVTFWVIKCIEKLICTVLTALHPCRRCRSAWILSCQHGRSLGGHF